MDAGWELSTLKERRDASTMPSGNVSNADIFSDVPQCTPQSSRYPVIRPDAANGIAGMGESSAALSRPTPLFRRHNGVTLMEN